MSRLGKKPIPLASGVKVEVSGKAVTVSGPRGTLSYALPKDVSVRLEDDKLMVDCDLAGGGTKANYGLARSLLQNMVTGVSDGFKRVLEIQGVGYRGQCKGQRVVLSLGYSHAVDFFVPEGIAVSMPSPTSIVLESIDKQAVGQAAATIRSFRPPDSYKGKGIRYAGEHVSLKEGKTVG